MPTSELLNTPTVSVIVSTDGRPRSLENTLAALCYVQYPEFEVCVVRGPTEDEIVQILNRWAGKIRIATCPERNLSMARNMGIAATSGDIVAFVDDDATPEPDWLSGLMRAYVDPLVGGAGGFVYDVTGVTFQSRFVTANRLGRADPSWNSAAPELCFPLSANFPHLLGTNSTFRRTALMEIGGFDEEYEYYLDETDLCCRLIDAGWRIVQVPGAAVHHKFLPSSMRNQQRTVNSWYSLFKNKIYYSLKNGYQHHNTNEIIDDARAFIEKFRQDMESAVAAEALPEASRVRFTDETDRALREGLVRGLAGERRLPAPGVLAGTDEPIQKFELIAPQEEHRCFVFFSREFSPRVVGGVGRYIEQMARAVANRGHEVHVFTTGEGYDRVDFECGVWVHRIVVRASTELSSLKLSVRVPQRILDYSTTMLMELRKLNERRIVSCVYAPIWDCEGIAVLLDGSFPLVTGLQTTVHFWLKSQPHLKADPVFMAEFGYPMQEAEAQLLRESSGIHAISEAIATEIAAAYKVELRGPRTSIIPLGLDDWQPLVRLTQAVNPQEQVPLRLLFVGRLERRKGIDVLLKAAVPLLLRYPEVRIDIVGNDRLVGPNGVSYRAAFETDAGTESIRNRVVFHGEVSSEALRQFYAGCDVFVAPSRFESFGLIFLEAMMFERPVVACRAGGIPEVVEEGVTGLLAEPGDPTSLEAKLDILIQDAQMRKQMGRAGRQRYERYFAASRMGRDITRFLCEIPVRGAGKKAYATT